MESNSIKADYREVGLMQDRCPSRLASMFSGFCEDINVFVQIGQ